MSFVPTDKKRYNILLVLKLYFNHYVIMCWKMVGRHHMSYVSVGHPAVNLFEDCVSASVLQTHYLVAKD